MVKKVIHRLSDLFQSWLERSRNFVIAFFTVPVLEEDARAEGGEAEGVEWRVVRARVLPREDGRLQVVLVHHADAHQAAMKEGGIVLGMEEICISRPLPFAVDNPEWREVHVIDPAGGSALGLRHEVAHLPVRPRHRLLPPVPATHHLLLLALKIEINLRASMFGKRMPFTGSFKKIPACLNLPALFLPTDLGSQCTAHQP